MLIHRLGLAFVRVVTDTVALLTLVCSSVLLAVTPPRTLQAAYGTEKPLA